MPKRPSDAAGIKSKPKLYSEICAEGLRKGKWTDEEEKYAATIIFHFENNLLPLSEQRESTIRLYLGKKLHCDPMRISKKFAGNNSVGKHFFCKKQEDGQNQTAEALDKAEKEREEMRRVFMESVEKEVEAASKRPKRIRIRNRKKKPRPELPTFHWDCGSRELSDDDIGDLHSLFNDKGKDGSLGFAATPCGSPGHTVCEHPSTPPSGPVPGSCEHENFVLDTCGRRLCAPSTPENTEVFELSTQAPQPNFPGGHVEPPVVRILPPPIGMPAPPFVGVTYGYMLVCAPSQHQQQAWMSAPLPQQLYAAAPVGAPQVFREDDLDARLEDILSCKDDTDNYDFLDSI